MKTNRSFSIILFAVIGSILFTFSAVTAQLGGPREIRKLRATPDEIISMSRSLPFNEALQVFNNLARKHLGKSIIDPTNAAMPIGVDIDKMHYIDAFELVIRTHNLDYEELEKYILVTIPSEEEDDQIPVDELRAAERIEDIYETREVAISAVFFQGDMTKLNQIGTGWSFLTFLQSIVLGDTLIDTTHHVAMTAGQNMVGALQVRYVDRFSSRLGGAFDQITSMFSILESHQFGEVISSPSVTVMSGAEGNIQIGTNFSITVKDFAGNAVTDFVDTGIILTVKPEIIEVDTTTFINLEIEAQNSSGSSGAAGIVIKTLSASTSILLLDGEETIIGGLYTYDQASVRSGVPFLKDIPWWFFGLRYLFGFESDNEVRKELVILLRADLLPSLRERVAAKLSGTEDKQVLKNSLENLEKRLEGYLDQTKGE